MHVTHLIIDDFLGNPDAVRNEALSYDYPPRPDRATYPGRNAARQIVLQGIERVISEIVHEPLVAAPNTSFGYPRLALAGDQSTVSIHTDFCHWSAMIYLSKDEHCKGGTHFFRHKATGWDMAPVFPGVAEAAGYASADEAMNEVLQKNKNDRSQWDETMVVPMKYNRIALFRGYLFHDAGMSFGDTPESGRLVLPFFFENPRPTA